jgi:hypothetical protein
VRRGDEHQANLFAVSHYFSESYVFNHGAHRANEHHGQRLLKKSVRLGKSLSADSPGYNFAALISEAGRPGERMKGISEPFPSLDVKPIHASANRHFALYLPLQTHKLPFSA